MAAGLGLGVGPRVAVPGSVTLTGLSSAAADPSSPPRRVTSHTGRAGQRSIPSGDANKCPHRAGRRVRGAVPPRDRRARRHEDGCDAPVPFAGECLIRPYRGRPRRCRSLDGMRTIAHRGRPPAASPDPVLVRRGRPGPALAPAGRLAVGGAGQRGHAPADPRGPGPAGIPGLARPLADCPPTWPRNRRARRSGRGGGWVTRAARCGCTRRRRRSPFGTVGRCPTTSTPCGRCRASAPTRPRRWRPSPSASAMPSGHERPAGAGPGRPRGRPGGRGPEHARRAGWPASCCPTTQRRRPAGGSR